MGRIGTVITRLALRQAQEGDVRDQPAHPADHTVLLVGNPNVGKSALFNWLTGRYATVSNYPGTTVEVSRGRSKALGVNVEVVDTPGMYSLLPITDEERVARSILLKRRPSAVIHVIDAKSIERMLALTLQLIEARLPVVLALNMWDEAKRERVDIDLEKLRRLLGVPVVATVAVSGTGMTELVEAVKGMLTCGAVNPDRKGGDSRGQLRIADCELRIEQQRKDIGDASGAVQSEICNLKSAIDYGPVIEKALAGITPHLGSPDGIGPRARALLLLHGDHEQTQALKDLDGGSHAQAVASAVWDATVALKHTPHYHTSLAVKAQVDRILAETAAFPPPRARNLRDRLGDLCMNPWTGFPLLAIVLYFGLYKFVGAFGAGTLVDKLDHLFKLYISPWVDRTAEALIPWATLRDLFGGEYGIVTLGLRYAIAIIFPIVGTFFLAFSVLEDSGYLPRLAMLLDRIFKRIGLNGRAVIPMVLGFGCDTMATMVTRTLETKRERIIATFLLALAIPCSAQVGLILGLLAEHPAALAVWVGIITMVFLAAGLLLAKFLPGERPAFYMELPPLRLPRIGNVIIKTYTRMVWYFKEVLPLFIIASVFIWIGRLDFWGLLPQGGLFAMAIHALEPVVRALGLPDKSATAFLFGFFRRDYGIAAMRDLQLVGNQLVVAAVTLTLFLPCIAQVLIMKKERGWRMTLLMSVFIAVFAFAAGWAVNATLYVLGVTL